jgi:ankyrin repeat protein
MAAASPKDILTVWALQEGRSTTARIEDEDWTYSQFAASIGVITTPSLQSQPTHDSTVNDLAVPLLSRAHILVHCGNTQSLSSIDKGEISQADQHGFTPLHFAVMRKNLPAVESLLALGADPRAQSNVSTTFL